MSVVTLHRIAFKSSAGLDRSSETYMAGVQALVNLYERVRAGKPEDILVLARFTNTIITTLCSSTHRYCPRQWRWGWSVALKVCWQSPVPLGLLCRQPNAAFFVNG